MAGGVLKITVDDRGLKHVAKALKNGHPALTAGLRLTGFAILRFWKNRYDSSPWPGLTAQSERKKRKYGYGGQPTLKATGQLYNVVDDQLKGYIPGRNFTITKKSVTVGYGGGAVYRPENKYTRAIGRISYLSQIHEDGAYRNGTPREIIIDPDSATFREVRKILNATFKKITDEGERMS